MLPLQFIHIYVELLFGCNNFKENASEHNLPQGARFSPVRTPPPARGFFYGYAFDLSDLGWDPLISTLE
jgi:hypothetical protein